MSMDKFIEVKRAENPEVFRFECDKEDEYILINVDHIVTITPKGEKCLIQLSGEKFDILVDHSASWVIGLINERP
jgi:hypothetical protein